MKTRLRKLSHFITNDFGADGKDIIICGNWSDDIYKELENTEWYAEEDSSHVTVWVKNGIIDMNSISISDGFTHIESIVLTDIEKKQIVKFIEDNNLMNEKVDYL